MYEQSSVGFVLADQELDRLTELHAAYASQPNITAVWQGYIDAKADSVTKQRLVVERLRAVVCREFEARASAAAAKVWSVSG